MQVLLEWLSEAEQTLRFRGVLPEEAETLQALLHTHRDFMGTVEEKRADVNKAAGMGEGILTVCHPDSITTIKHWITIIRARFEEVRLRYCVCVFCANKTLLNQNLHLFLTHVIQTNSFSSKCCRDKSTNTVCKIQRCKNTKKCKDFYQNQVNLYN